MFQERDELKNSSVLWLNRVFIFIIFLFVLATVFVVIKVGFDFHAEIFEFDYLLWIKYLLILTIGKFIN